MHVTIKYRLSETAQKASILAGGDGKAEQTATVPQDSALFAAALEQASISSDGSATLEIWVKFDALPSLEELVGHRAAEAAQKAAKEQAKVQDARARTLDAFTGRHVKTHEITVGGKTWTFAEPSWPYISEYSDGSAAVAAAKSVRESPEVQAWIQELAALEATAKAEAKAEQDRINAEEQATKDKDAAVRSAWREKYGLEEDDIVLDVEDGALASVPSGCWESHKRGKNWLAIITVDPSKPGGFDRRFAEKAKGSSYYLLPDWQPGDALEFGADYYYSGGGRKSPTRWYGFYVRSFDGQGIDGEDRSYVVLRKVAGGKTACKEGAKYAKEHGRVDVTDAIAAGIARVNGEGSIVPSDN